MRIKAVTINDKVIALGKLTVLVGPNNVGKSQFLRDIKSEMDLGQSSRKVILERIEFEPENSFSSFCSELVVKENTNDTRYYRVGGLYPSLLEGNVVDSHRDTVNKSFNVDLTLGNLAKFKVTYLDTSSRLRLSEKALTATYDEPPKNPLQGLWRLGGDSLLEIQKIFRRSFDMDIILDYSELQVLRFRLSSKFQDIPSHPQEASPILARYPILDDQGDGFRSLVGIVVGFILSKQRIILLDEPEAFLHPKQCRILGSWIASYSNNTDNQIIISTHNGNFLTGMLSANPSMAVFRMNRRDDTTEVLSLSSDNLKQLSSSPLLSGQPIFESLFHEGVVVCEGDADRSFYQTVAVRYLKNDSVFFLHSYGKQNVKEIVKLTRTSGVPVAAIVDIDILNSAEELEGLLKGLNPDGAFEEILRIREDISDEIEKEPENQLLEQVQMDLSLLSSDLKNGKISLSRTRNRLRDIRRGATKWDEIKSKGISALSGEQQEKARQLIKSCDSYGLFIVYKGELEGWMNPPIGKNKSKWVVKAVETLDEGRPQELINFLEEIFMYLRKSNLRKQKA